MLRNAKGLGRTGRKHKKKAAGGPKAQSKISSGEGGPPSSPVPQETATAKDNVAKRIEYIQTELDRYTGVIEESQKEADAKRTKVLQMQQAAQGA